MSRTERLGTARRRLGLALAAEGRVVVLALALAVAAVSGVGFFTERVGGALAARADTMLGGDLLLRDDHPLDEEVTAEIDRLGLRSVSLLTFPSVALNDEDDTALVSVKVVEAGYPLRGELISRTTRVGGAPLSGEIPQAGEVWVEDRLLADLRLNIGDTLFVGALAHPITRVITYESDRSGSLFQIAPRVMLNRADLEAAELLGEGSRVNHITQLVGEADQVTALQGFVTARAQPGLEIETIGSSRPGVQRSLDRVGRFLGMAAMLTVLVAGAAVAVSLQEQVTRASDEAAVRRAFGATHRQVLVRVLTVLSWQAVLGIAVGLVLGLILQAGISQLLGALFATDLPLPGPAPVVAGVVTAIITLAGFGLPALLGIQRVPVMRVLRRELGAPPPAAWVLIACAVAALAVLLLWQARDVVLAGLVLGALVGATAALYALAAALQWLAGRMRGKLRPGWRFGFAAIARRGAFGRLQLAATGLGLLSMLLLSTVGTDLLRTWQRELPEDVPNLFLVNVQPDDATSVQGRLEEMTGDAVDIYPMTRGRLVAINGQSVVPEDFIEEARRTVSREWNMTSAELLRPDNIIVDGDWWAPGSRVDEVSLEEELAEELGVGIGDRMTLRVAGVDVEATISSLRKVDWGNFKPNFFAILHPSVRENLATTYMTSVRLDDNQRDGAVADIVRDHPGVTALDVRSLIERVTGLIDAGAGAVRYTLVLTLLAGAVVLVAGVQASTAVRIRESALQRVLGASRREVRRAVLAEFASLGAAAGFVAAVVALLAGQLVARLVFEVDLSPSLWPLIVGPLGGGLGLALAGWLAARGAAGQPPGVLLRRL